MNKPVALEKRPLLRLPAGYPAWKEPLVPWVESLISVCEGQLFANGNKAFDPWNQWFLPCWVTGWQAQEWAFLQRDRLVHGLSERARAVCENESGLRGNQ